MPARNYLPRIRDSTVLADHFQPLLQIVHRMESKRISLFRLLQQSQALKFKQIHSRRLVNNIVHSLVPGEPVCLTRVPERVRQQRDLSMIEPLAEPATAKQASQLALLLGLAREAFETSPAVK